MKSLVGFLGRCRRAFVLLILASCARTPLDSPYPDGGPVDARSCVPVANRACRKLAVRIGPTLIDPTFQNARVVRRGDGYDAVFTGSAMPFARRMHVVGDHFELADPVSIRNIFACSLAGTDRRLGALCAEDGDRFFRVYDDMYREVINEPFVAANPFLRSDANRFYVGYDGPAFQIFDEAGGMTPFGAHVPYDGVNFGPLITPMSCGGITFGATHAFGAPQMLQLLLAYGIGSEPTMFPARAMNGTPMERSEIVEWPWAVDTVFASWFSQNPNTYTFQVLSRDGAVSPIDPYPASSVFERVTPFPMRWGLLLVAHDPGDFTTRELFVLGPDGARSATLTLGWKAVGDFSYATDGNELVVVWTDGMSAHGAVVACVDGD